MKSQSVIVTSTLIVTLFATPAFAANGFGATNARGPVADTCTSCVLEELDGSEAATLTFMREEEKLARDIYNDMNTLWQAPIFANIAAAEQRHMDSVKDMLDKYALPDPAGADVPNVYMDPELQQLFDDLQTRGELSYQEALLVGALIEEVDIEDNQLAIEQTDNADLQTLYANLLRGSRNHLRAFVAEYERLGVVYAAQYLEQSAVDEIVDSSMERGAAGNRGGRNGQGNGGGQ